MWSEMGLKKAQVQYLSAELFCISHQREKMRNSETEAKQLIDHKNNRDKREIALYKRQMELSALKIDYWKKRKQSEFPENK